MFKVRSFKILSVLKFKTIDLVESVEPENDISLEGWTDCKVLVIASHRFRYISHLSVLCSGIHQRDRTAVCLVLFQRKSAGVQRLPPRSHPVSWRKACQI